MTTGEQTQQRSLTRRRWRDAGIVLGITVVVGLASQRWAGLDTPDSSFYTTLALFGDQITDRAPFDSYYWTRVGQIAPNMALTSVLGPWVGFAAYRMLLLLVIVASSYRTLRRFTSWPSATVLTTLISLNTVVLSYLGNPYLTGSVLAGTSALIALSLSDGRRAAIASGAVLGWLVMVNPSGVILAGVIWFAIRIVRLKDAGLTKAVQHLVIAAVATVVTFAVFLALGKLIFPAMNWFETYAAAMGINLSNFASTEAVWLKDISLLVPAGIAVVVTITWLTHRTSTPARLAATISLTSVISMLLFSPLVMGGIALEAPMYQAMLWPPALIALGLAAASVTSWHTWTPWTDAIAAIAVVGVNLAGRWPGAMPLQAGWLLSLILVVAAISGLKAARNLGAPLLAITGVAILLIGAQFLQNSRGPLGLYYLSPYNWAFNDNPIDTKIRTAVNAQEWLLDRTTSNDRILTWVGGNWVQGDRELYVVAGMQLWGENRATLEPQLAQADVRRLDDIKPSAIAMYAPTMEQVVTFWESIPAANRASAPQCYDFTWPVDPGVGHACLTRLTWSS